MELELIQGCVKNDRTSQKKLFDTYAGRFMAIAKRYMKEDMSAEDVLMEGFCKIYKNIKSFKGEGSFEGWMRRIIVNTALYQLRKDNRDLLVYQEELIDKGSVEMMYFENMSANDMMKMIEKMPLGYRTVFNMYAIDGFSHKEIANELKIDEGTSRSQLLKARKFLQIRIKENESDIRI